MFTSPWTPGWLPHLDCGPLWQFLPPLQAGRLQVSRIMLIKHKNLYKGYLNRRESLLEHKTCDILAAERLRLMRFDNRLIIDSFQKAICILKW